MYAEAKVNKAKDYSPSQPFFELTTKGYVSRLASPHKPLAKYYSFVVAEDVQDTIVAVPDGTVDILFHCSSSKPLAEVCGSVKKGTRIEFEKGALYFGARFYPGTANQFLNCPIEQFTDKQILLEDVLKKTEGLSERICNATSFDQKIGVFEHFCSHREEELPAPALMSYILNKINLSHGDIKLQTLADDTGYSTRYINNAFKKHVGIAPKLFMRIIRFQRCFGVLREQTKSLNFAELALESGYYDQAHFINEFKEFSLYTPTQAQSAARFH
jgi:AraC-like DNA-binding protein